ncbi:hypothetical protein D3C76_806680 [compost metagenome]
MGAGIQPGVAASHDFHRQSALFEIGPVDVGDLQFAAGGGPDAPGDVHHLLVVEVEPGHRIVGFRFLRLFLDADGPAVAIELHDAVTLRVVDVVGEHAGAGFALGRVQQQFMQVVAMEDVVAEYQRIEVVADEGFADQEGLGQSVRGFLECVVQVEAPLAAVAQQLLEAGRVLGRRDDQDLADTGQHQRAERVIDHRLVVDRQQLLGNGQRRGMKAGAGAAGENDAFALHGVSCSASSSSMRRT